jgi:hypothetical protein
VSSGQCPPAVSRRRGHSDEIVLIDLLALLLSVGTVSIIWYVAKKTFPDDVKDLQFFLSFIVVVIPFVMVIYLGLAVINYDAMAALSGWPLVLPLDGPLSPPVVGLAAFYIGQTMWLWWDWRKLRIRDEALTLSRGDRS